jgi:hypothetical protein
LVGEGEGEETEAEEEDGERRVRVRCVVCFGGFRVGVRGAREMETRRQGRH